MWTDVGHEARLAVADLTRQGSVVIADDPAFKRLLERSQTFDMAPIWSKLPHHSSYQ